MFFWSHLLWRNCSSWQDVEKPSLAGRRTTSLRLLFGSKSAWQISQATDKQRATSSPALSFISPKSDAHCTIRTRQWPSLEGSPYPNGRESPLSAFSYLAFSGALPTPRPCSQGWGGEEGCGRYGAFHVSGWSPREGQASEVTEQKPRDPRPPLPRSGGGSGGGGKSLARRLSRAQRRRTRNPLGRGPLPG